MWLDYLKNTKAACSTQSENLIKNVDGKLSVNDPAQALCTIVTAQLAATQGSIANILVGEVVSRGQKIYDEKVANILKRIE